MTSNVQQYFDELTEDRKQQITVIHDLILQLYPKAIVDMQYKMPTYKAAEGWVALASQKYYISVYTCGAHHLENFKIKQPKIKTGKGCINFKPGREMPIDDLTEVIRHAMDYPKG